MKNNKWNIIHECDDDNGQPTCWSKEINHQKYGKYVWISKESDSMYAVEVIPYTDTRVLMTCKSLASAKRWVTINIG